MLGVVFPGKIVTRCLYHTVASMLVDFTGTSRASYFDHVVHVHQCLFFSVNIEEDNDAFKSHHGKGASSLRRRAMLSSLGSKISEKL